ncbi:type I methionyl aminopeptidase [Niameybacter massiliensis]|uniref:Methionine aminopeptidase n=2 Tax=Clostridia TaxID=186801 RepID=A0AA42DP85_9FIRM|nr:MULTISPECIES: type I methionyl aminopeptidase [Lachnospirales]MDA3732208.1 type I methionyl aminopeptidase [Holtiella tumoricola]
MKMNSKVKRTALDEKLDSYRRQGYIVPPKNIIKNEKQIEAIKKSAVINTAILDHVAEHIKEGMTTLEIDEMVYRFTKEHDATPAPLNYHGFPKSVCISINQEVCHGIPSKDRVLQNGDIVNVDVSTIYHGYFSDASRMFIIGEASEEAKKVVEVARECMQKGIEQVKPWGLLGDVGAAINAHAKAHGYSVVREIGGHGVGLAFHEDPYVSHVSKAGTGMLLVPGMIFTIEPMVNVGTARVKEDKKNGWTIYTADGKLSAQWESMVLVTETGYEILTC